MWPGRRRIRRLEDEIAVARADQTDLKRRLQAFETIAEAAGAGTQSVWWGTSVPETPMPTSLVAAARESSPREAPVRLDVAGADVIAVIAGPGDPREWWSAIWQLAAQAGDAS